MTLETRLQGIKSHLAGNLKKKNLLPTINYQVRHKNSGWHIGGRYLPENCKNVILITDDIDYEAEVINWR